jgi:hypothetical protein
VVVQVQDKERPNQAQRRSHLAKETSKANSAMPHRDLTRAPRLRIVAANQN